MLWALLQAHFVQDFLIDRITGKLSKELNTTVKAEHVNIELFNRVRLTGFLVLDRQQDTLLYANSFVINTSSWLLMTRKLELKYIGLENAVINLKRDSADWNYQFIASYFSREEKEKKKKSQINLNLNMVRMINVTVNQHDKWEGSNKYAHIGELRLEVEQLDILNKELKIRALNLRDPNFAIYDYQGNHGEEDTDPQNRDSVTSKNEVAEKDWVVSGKKIAIENGVIAIQKEDSTLSVPRAFDGSNIRITGLNAEFDNSRFKDDTLTSRITLSFQERSGFMIRRLRTDYTLTPTSMELNNLDLETNTSRLKNSFIMHYDSFGEGMKDFVHKVRMEGTFDNSVVTTDDIGYFSPEIKKWGTTFFLNGNIEGEVDNLKSDKLEITFNNNNRIKGKFSLSGLPDTGGTYIDADVEELVTNITDASKIIPSLKDVEKPDLKILGTIYYQGKVGGYLKNLNIDGSFSTALGVLTTNVGLNLTKSPAVKIDGDIGGVNFDFGTFLSNKSLGKATFQTNISGELGGTNTNNFLAKGLISQVTFNHYDLRNIDFNGGIKNEALYGEINIHDTSLDVRNLNAIYNFNSEKSHINVSGTFNYINFKNLNIIKHGNISLKGDVHIDLEKEKSDDYFGIAQLTNASVTNDSTQFTFDSLSIRSVKDGDKKLLTLATNELSAKLEGQYHLTQVGGLFQSFLHQYFPSYIPELKEKPLGQKFSFQIKIDDISDWASVITNKTLRLTDINIRGNADESANQMEITLEAPELFYDSRRIDGLKLAASSSNRILTMNLGFEDIQINDSTQIPQTIFEATASNDTTNLHIYTPDDSLNYSVNLAATLLTYEGGVALSINPSQILFNGEAWSLIKGGQIAIRNKLISIKDFKIQSEDQSIDIFSQPSKINTANDVFVNLNNIRLDNVLPLFISSPRIGGRLTTHVRINNPLPFDSATLSFDSKISKFQFENFEIGDVSVAGNYDAVVRSFYTTVQSEDVPYKFTANLLYQEKDHINPLTGTINFANMRIDILNPYLTGIADNITGEARGILNVSGTPENPEMRGNLTLNQTSLKIDYTQCTYTFVDNSKIEFSSNEMVFNSISLRDVKGAPATLSGTIRHNFFTNFVFDNLRLRTSEKFQLLNTTSKDNNQFYGNMTGQANLTINGPAEDLVMNISGTPTDSSHIFLPIGSTADTKGLDYIDFIQFGRELEIDKKTNNTSNISVNIEINATPLATVDVILDETTGDVIKANGSGKLIMTAGTSEPFTIRGRYTIEGGEYTFNFQTFLKTPFILQQGFIEWQGDPYQAILNVDAIYQAQNVNLSAIPTSTGYTNALGDIDVIIKLRGTLENPNPDFEFQFTFNNPLKSDPIASEFLRTRYQSNKNEMLSQVASLLLFNTFMSDEQGGAQAATASTSFVGKTFGQILSSKLTSELNGWMQKTFNTSAINLYTNISPSDLAFQPRENASPVQNIGNFGVRYAFHNNKYIFYLGSNLNYRVNSGIASNNADLFVTPDFSFEMLLTPNGNLRVIGFNRSDLDPINIAGITSRNRTGVQLSYRKDFETFKEFFTGTGIRKKKKTELD